MPATSAPAANTAQTAARTDPQQDVQSAPQPPVPNQDPKAIADKPQEQKAVEALGLNYNQINDEYRSTGTLSEKTVDHIQSRLEKAGFGKDEAKAMIQNHLANNHAQEQLFIHRVHQTTGGEEGYAAMAEWARGNLSEAELKTFSDMAETSDPEKAMMAVKLLFAQYQQATQLGGQRLKADVGSSAPSGVYRSMAELQAALADPRYKNDKAFQADVQQRLQNSYTAGTLRG